MPNWADDFSVASMGILVCDVCVENMLFKTHSISSGIRVREL